MSVTFPTLIETLSRLVRAGEAMLPLIDDEDAAEAYDVELEELEEACNYARGVLLAAGHPVEP